MRCRLDSLSPLLLATALIGAGGCRTDLLPAQPGDDSNLDFAVEPPYGDGYVPPDFTRDDGPPGPIDGAPGPGPDGGPDGDASDPGCPPGTIRCGLICLDPSRDPVNCGGCGRVCTGGTSCVDASCVCPRGQMTC